MPYRSHQTNAAIQFALFASLMAGSAFVVFLAAYGAYALVNPCGR
jgi:hypothetical protein